jgi:hypothetical protein
MNAPVAETLSRRKAGISYAEVLVALLVLALALVPALDALSVGVASSSQPATSAIDHYWTLGRLEEVLAEPIALLDAAASAAGGPTTPTSYSDAIGAPNRLLVFVARYDGDDADGDGDPFTGGDAGLLHVRVALASGAAELSALVTW